MRSVAGLTRKIPFQVSEALLSCEHVVTYKGSAPRKDDYVPCVACRSYSYVAQVTRKGIVGV